MKKVNLWNKLFHAKKLQEEKAKYEKYKLMLNTDFLERLKKCKTLEDLLATHRSMWKAGFRNENLGPCSCGMFRTDSIENLVPSEVYLGGFWGLVTQNIPFWNKYKEETMAGNGFGMDEDTKIYDLLMNQYKSLLCSNLQSIRNEMTEFVDEYSQKIIS